MVAVEIVEVEEGEEEEEEEVDLSRQPVADLTGTKLEYSTLEESSRGATMRRKCNLCKHEYNGGPFAIRAHLIPGGKRSVKVCSPHADKDQRYREVLAALRLRQAADSAKEAEAARLRAARGAARNATSGGGNLAVEANHNPMFKVPTADQVDDQWARCVGKNNLALSLVDEPEFRKFVLMTAQSGKGMICVERAASGEKQSALCHRTKLTTTVVPRVDKVLEEKMVRKVEKMAKALGCTGTGDGWKDPNGHPMINFLQNTPAATRFVACIDASGARKDAKYQARFVIESMLASGGVEVYVVVFFDGACEPSFKHIILVRFRESLSILLRLLI
jgi:hypothetical protein